MSQTILVGIDGTERGLDAMALGRLLAEGTGAELVATHVYESNPASRARGVGQLHVASSSTPAKAYPFARAREELMRSHLDRGLALVPDDIEVSGELATPGMPTLADQEDVDVLVLGSRGYGPIRRLLLGSVSTRLVRSAPCPVIMYPRSAERGGEESHTIAGGSARASS